MPLNLTNDPLDQTAPPQPITIAYEPARDRENVRGHLAYIVVGIFAVLVVATFITAIFAIFGSNGKVEGLLQVVGVLLSPVVALVGAVTGFYYGEKAGSR
ncbi:hypothetical protein ACE7GA_25770 [Roseomonas sp. CCTCC AB2023176]|uniref:hypothetical protein n=1 Tax=Roseomonas sp. CCTCC AB2023176 TaxID=3342640 RepID=UPI0035D81A0C